MGGSIIAGLVAGLILGLVQMFGLGGGIDTMISSSILGAAIGFLGPKIPSFGIIGAAAAAGAILFAISALISGYVVLDHTITGAITGAVIGLIIKFVVPKVMPK